MLTVKRRDAARTILAASPFATHDGGVTRSTRTGRPPVTSRAQILDAARDIIERDGWEKVTIRRLASDLGIGATTLYHHIRDREDLLIQLLNDQAGRSSEVSLPAAPRDRIIVAAGMIHESLRLWPWAAEVLATDGFLARLGDSALDLVEAILAGAVEIGCTGEQAVELFRSIWYYIAGEIMVRSRSAHLADAQERRRGFLTDIDPERFPQLAAIGGDWPVIAAHDTFANSLQAFVDGLLAQAVAQNG